MGNTLNCKKKNIYFKVDSYPYTLEMLNPKKPNNKTLNDNYSNKQRNMIKHHNITLYSITKPQTYADVNNIIKYIRTLASNEIYGNLRNVLLGYRYINELKINTKLFIGEYTFVNMIGLILMQYNSNFALNILLDKIISLDSSILNHSCVAVIDPYSKKPFTSTRIIQTCEKEQYSMNISPMILSLRLNLNPSTISLLLNNRYNELFYVLDKAITSYEIYINNIQLREELTHLMKNIMTHIIKFRPEKLSINQINIYRRYLTKNKEMINKFDIIDTSYLMDELYALDEHLLKLQYQTIINHILETSDLKELTIDELITNECCVCLDNHNDSFMGITDCGHFICNICFNDLLKHNCPICDNELKNDSVTFYD